MILRTITRQINYDYEYDWHGARDAYRMVVLYVYAGIIKEKKRGVRG